MGFLDYRVAGRKSIVPRNDSLLSPIGLSGSSLKIIAIVAMLIDHVAFGIWYRLPGLGYLVPEVLDLETWYAIYRGMRGIGRLAFPIFAFLLVEGFFHTASRPKYALRLLVFAVISQLPLHYAFLGLTDSILNIFVTLLIAFLAMWGMEASRERWPARYIYIPLWIVIIATSSLSAEGLRTDYGLRGVALVLIFYMLHKSRPLALAVGAVAFILTDFRAVNVPGFILPLLYDGRRGLPIKYFFYIFYPVHLALIFLVWRYLL